MILGRTDTGCLGFGEDGGRHDVEADAIALAKNLVDSMHSLHLGSMGKHLTAIDVTYGIHPHSRALLAFPWLFQGEGRYDSKIIINGDGTVGSEGNSQLFKAKPFSTGFAACSHQDHVGIDICKVFYCSLHAEGDAAFLQIFAETLGDITIQCRQTFLKILDNSNLRAETVKHRGKLHANDACTDNGETLGESIEVKQARGIDHTGIGLDALNGEPFGLGACGDDNGSLPKNGSLTKYCFFPY